jgi:hypothetical protein
MQLILIGYNRSDSYFNYTFLQFFLGDIRPSKVVGCSQL